MPPRFAAQSSPNRRRFARDPTAIRLQFGRDSAAIQPRCSGDSPPHRPPAVRGRLRAAARPTGDRHRGARPAKPYNRLSPRARTPRDRG
ncbi:hypothetical protein D0U02_11885 [Burkholderia pseudomallei]|nr:hypothetical protein BOC51_07555 [Burkholderia pseudomallei]AYX34125.1 hypothetical protein EGY15_02245 [Burkholderia pseudomallei]PNX10340.1 hypothetical protein CF641_00895 [Burkholderia pseudomallei]PNX44739.1 hypothetical protein CF642_02700 [Burkholderia pseudomallei]RAP94563.1 hypothetical protein DPQ97_01035 [Burkholderia pseudomallei]